MKKLLFAAIAFLFSSFALNAQTLKFGHIDSSVLIQLMPATKQADSTLRRYAESLDGQLKAMSGEYQSKLQSYQSKADSLPDAIRTTKEKELTDLGQRIQDFQQTAQESIQKKKEELYSPILNARKMRSNLLRRKKRTRIFLIPVLVQ
jgi:outer membrane protein